MALSKATASRRTKVVKPRLNKKRTTLSHRQFQFRSFAERVSSLHIDPIRRRRDREEQEEIEDVRTSYFSRSLARWREINLSKTFTTFARQVAPLADNLPLVLHNQDQIMRCLLDSISQRDDVALEPLTGLLVDFAHDLDIQFERHFAAGIDAVADVAADSEDAKVVEWCFTCIAWLFKYLSRLLVPDLRPVFDLIRPYLGTKSQKPHVIRFAAESLSFLVRKAALSKDSPESLAQILKHMLGSAEQPGDATAADLYQQGIMTLLTGAMKGVHHKLHSSGMRILQQLLAVIRLQPSDIALTILRGCLTSLIHFSTVATFKEILDAVLADLESQDPSNDQQCDTSLDILFVLTSVRKGSRITSWDRVLRQIDVIATRNDGLPKSLRSKVASTLAVAMTVCTTPLQLERMAAIDALASVDDGKREFLHLCDMVARLDTQRFNTLLVPRLRTYLPSLYPTDHLSMNELQELAALLLAVPLHSFRLDVKLLTVLILQLSRLSTDAEPDSDVLGECYYILEALPYIQIPGPQAQQLHSILTELITKLSSAASSPDPTVQQMIFGRGLQLWLAGDVQDHERDDILLHLCHKADSIIHSSPIWHNILTMLGLLSRTELASELWSLLQSSLLRNLSLSSADMRLVSLEILQQFYALQGQEIPKLLETARSIEITPVNLETARTISMSIRRLGAEYYPADANDIVAMALPSYCLGLLHLPLTQLWTDVLESLASMMRHSVAEEGLMSTVKIWLEQPQRTNPRRSEPSIVLLDGDMQSAHISSEFDCPNLAKFAAISQQVLCEPRAGRPTTAETIQSVADFELDIVGERRGQALRLLNKVGDIAEKRSRLLVPILLEWSGEPTQDDADSSTERWSRKDMKALLSIFAKFHNPKVLYRSAEVQQLLLKLCLNGDIEIQKPALEAVLAWKSPGLIRYQSHLRNVLDDAKFREELTVFLQSDDEDALTTADTSNVMPILLRLIYGRLIGGTKDGQQSRRKAAFVALARYDESVLEMFINITTGGVHKNQSLQDAGSAGEIQPPLRQQLGMLNMLSNMVDVIGYKLASVSAQLLHAILSCTISASDQLQQYSPADTPSLSLVRAVRQQGMTCLVKLFTSIKTENLSQQSLLIRSRLLIPRLERFVSENGQGVSSTLRLIATWCQNPLIASLLWTGESDILSRVAQTLQASVTKDEVKLFIMDEVLRPLLALHSTIPMPLDDVSLFADGLAALLESKPEKRLLDHCTRLVAVLAALIDDSTRAQTIVRLCSKLLTQPMQMVSARTKVDLLRATIPLVQLEDVSVDRELYDAVCGLFSRLSGLQTRATLADTFSQLCKKTELAQGVADLCLKLNAVNASRLDEQDHAKQEEAFFLIYSQSETLTADQWKPLMHNCIFLIHDEEDMVNRSSAAKALKQLIDAAQHNVDTNVLVQKDLFPAILRGMHRKSEFVRAEYLNLLGHLIAVLRWEELGDMMPLVKAADDQLSVFADLLSIQQHKRLQALRQLGASTTLSSLNIDRIFLPLLEHFVLDPAAGDAGRSLADQTILTMGGLAHNMRWTHLRKSLSRYYTVLKAGPEHDKIILRLISAMIDGLVVVLQKPFVTSRHEDEIDATGEIDDTTNMSTATPVVPTNRTDAISRVLLPPLVTFLHQKDESEIDRRVVVAISIVKLLKLLPQEEFIAKLASTLTDIAQILKSRDFEAREQSRRTLSNILQLVGLQYLGFMLKEMRGALLRGYQLHVLSYSVHHLLATNSDSMVVGALDECIDVLTTVIMDDTFGTIGIEKETEEYRSNVKEIKASKSYDTMEILARNVSIARFGQLLNPLRAMLLQKLDTVALKKIDNLLRRIQQGIEQNPEANTRDVLSLYHELLRNSPDSMESQANESHKTSKVARPKYKLQADQSTSTFGYKITAFALGGLRKTLRKHTHLQTVHNVTAFVPILEDLLVAEQDECKYEAAKTLSTLIHLPMSTLDAGAAVYLKEAITMIKNSRSTSTDGARAGLELATSILREKRDAQIREPDVALLLRHIKADLDQPDRQGQTFRFLRAVLGRKIVVTEVYEVMDEIAKSMINNPDEAVRQNARSAYVQFLIDFPQSHVRWTYTMAFLIKNFGFDHAGGRRSALEAVHSLLARLPDAVVQDLALGLFVGLVPVLVNDPDKSCKDMTAALINQLIDKASTENLQKIKMFSMKWLHKGSNAGIAAAAMQCYRIMLQASKVDGKDTNALMALLSSKLDDTRKEHEDGTQDALSLFLTLSEHHPEHTFSNRAQSLWKSFGQRSLMDTQDMQGVVLQLYRLLFDDVARTIFSASTNANSRKLTTSNGLELEPEYIRQLCLDHIRCLRGITENVDAVTAENLTRNLLFLGRLFDATNMPWVVQSRQHDSSESEAELDGEGVDSRSALSYLFSRLAYSVRREGIPVRARMIALQTAGALVSIASHNLPNLMLLVRPLYVLTDSSLPQRGEIGHEGLVDKAREALALVEEKVGSEKYVSLLTDARRSVIDRRDDRRRKRRIEAVSQPEKSANDKRKRHVAKKSKIKAKADLQRARKAIY